MLVPPVLPPGLWPTSRWEVLTLGERGVTAPIQAAGALIGRYWYPRVPWVQKVLTRPEMAFQPPFPES